MVENHTHKRSVLLAGLLTLLFSLGSVGMGVAQDPDPDPDIITDPDPNLAGVAIDADGVVHRQVFRDPTGQLRRRRIAEARAALDPDIARPSPLRKVSLTRLERAIAKQLEAGRQPTAAMRHLAGLTRAKYVFLYPDAGDIVIAGPAEGWAEDLNGRMRGMKTGRPVLLLEDLVVALRAYPPGGKQAGLIFCSIDPTQEGLARMQQFLRSIGGQAHPGQTQAIVHGLQTSLGLQTVRVGGVPPSTHLARVMVEADYRMKLIGIGLERPPVKLTSYVARANPAAVSRNALQRWYFVPNYESVRVADDELAMELVGSGVKLIGQNELVGADGGRIASRKTDRASHLFVTGFTKKYAQLAKAAPIYAQLRNVIDLLVAAAFMQKHDYYARANWSMEVLRDESQLPVEIHNAPRQVASAVNSIWKGNRLMTPIGGGVEIRASLALKSENLLQDNEDAVKQAHGEVRFDNLPDDRWWWD